MSESEMKRAVHRGVAILLIPLSGTSNLPEVVESSLPGISQTIGIVVFTIAVLYLGISGTRQLVAAADTPF